MFNLVWAQSRNWTSRVLDRQSALPRNFDGSPAAIPFLLAVSVVALLILFRTNPLLFVASRLSTDQLGGVLSVDQAKATFDALAASVGEQIRELSLILVRPVASDSSDADDGDEQPRVITVRIDQYPSVANLVATNARVIDDNSMSRLQKMVCRLPEAACAEKLRHIIQADAPRFSTVIRGSWILHTYPDAFADPHELTKESTKNWVCKLKITTRLLCLMKCQLNEQDWLRQTLKAEYFAEVAGPYIRVLVQVASAFSSAEWTTGDVSNMVPIFEALLDSLCNIKQSLSIHVNVANIFRKVVNAFKVLIEGSENDLQRSEECAIISATYYLIVALEFFYRNRNVQPILASADSGYTIDLCNCWISKVEEDGKRLFPNEVDRQYIFILNNMYFVWEKKCRGEGFLSVETLKDWFNTRIGKYIKMYVGEYWVPVGQHIEGDHLIKPCRLYLSTFLAKFDSECVRQMKWKVLQPDLRNKLREEIKTLLVTPYGNFLASLVESFDKKEKGLIWTKIKGAFCTGKVDIVSNNDSAGIKVYSVKVFEDQIKNLYEG